LGKGIPSSKERKIIISTYIPFPLHNMIQHTHTI
jgi:hypothetical protein